MARSKLKRGPWAEPHDPTQIYISGPTMLIDRETKIRVGTDYYLPNALLGYGAGWWVVLRIMQNSIEFQQHHTGLIEKFKKADLKIHLQFVL